MESVLRALFQDFQETKEEYLDAIAQIGHCKAEIKRREARQQYLKDLIHLEESLTVTSQRHKRTFEATP